MIRRTISVKNGEKNDKKIKLLRKTFFTNFIRIHYSQFSEDIILKELIKEDYTNGFYVDVGCYHPKKFSNTYMLYRKGWRGINIDMEQDKIKLFNMARPKDYNVISAVSDKREKVLLHRFGSFGLSLQLTKTLLLAQKIKY